MGADLRVVNLFHDIPIDIFDDDLATGRGIGDFLLSALDTTGVLLVSRDSLRLLALLFDSLVALLLVFVQAFEELLDRGNGIGARVVPARGMLLLLFSHGG